MIKFNLWITNDHYRFFKKISKNSNSISEYMRIAFNEYIEKKKKEELNVSTSKGGDK